MIRMLEHFVGEAGALLKRCNVEPVGRGEVEDCLGLACDDGRG